MSIAVILIIVGIVVAIGSFLFAAINMAKGASNILGDDFNKAPASFSGLFSRHIGAMIGMVLGGLLLSIGLVMGGVELLGHLLAK